MASFLTLTFSYRGNSGNTRNTDAAVTVPAPSSISTGSFRSNGSSTPQPAESQVAGVNASAGVHSSAPHHDASSSKQIDVPTATLVNTSDDPVSPVLSGTLRRQKTSSPGTLTSFKLTCILKCAPIMF